MSAFRLFSWGANSHGQLGHGDIEAEELLWPKEVDLSSTDLRPEDIVKIVGGAGHTLLLDKAGRVFSCGWNSKGQTGLPAATSRFERIEAARRIVDVACGWDSSMAVTESGELYVWGSNSHGQLGQRIALGGRIDEPRKVEFETDVLVDKLAMGLRHSALVTRDGRVLVSGAATKGQLGIELRGPRCSERFMEVGTVRDVKDVSCGQHHTAVITNAGEIITWGDNKHGQLGIDPELQKGSSIPSRITKIEASCSIYCGWTHTAVLNSNKEVFLWGRNTYGQLGCRETAKFWCSGTIRVPAKIEQLSVGSEHNVALTDDGTVLSWGWNEHGNCGNGSIENLFEPIKVSLPKGLGVLVGTGAGHSLAVIKTNS